jgi:TM2 domain-containing membrane protein YozV
MKDNDLRKYARQTNIRLIVGGLLVLFIVGDGLIYLFQGAGPALTGLLCLTVGLLPIALIMVFLWILEWVVKRANRE